MSEQPLSPQRRYLVKHTTRTAAVGGLEVRYRIDVDTLHRDESATTLELNDLGRVRMELSSPLVFDSYRRNRITGSLIVIDEATNETVGGGGDPRHRAEVEDAPAAERKTERSPNVRWQRSTHDARASAGRRSGTPARRSGSRGCRPPASRRSRAPSRSAWWRRGVRRSCSTATICATDSTATSASTSSARAENVRRTAHVARLLAESGAVALVSLVSPYACDRELAAGLHAADELHFIEVFVSTPLAQCEQRDPKGLYARARAGELHGLTGRRGSI